MTRDVRIDRTAFLQAFSVRRGMLATRAARLTSRRAARLDERR
jgi:hypothetical protein